ncbi:hypothetical protein GH714_017010 [Hevea brasiliensis]|uniref:Guanosine nucleotide diphosphate dissociation inhibitor n=1 Tax=Hevea brasiliensis TaxID=3981 RepID=A0A6A6K8X2_HEVBR|nr:hypothetical protein GH714_017010 [Hevea brasiliensis]
MDEEYDVVVLGTGLKECILSGLLSVDGLKVLHMDRNDYYGGESTSLNLNQFMMANGALIRILIHTNVTKYLNFKAGMVVLCTIKERYKVPANDVEALKSPLMGLLRSVVLESFSFMFKTIMRMIPSLMKDWTSTRKYGLDDNTVDFIGHALALYLDENYLDEPALDFVKRMKAFARLSAVYGGTYMLCKPECKVEFDADGKAYGVTSEGETAKCKKVVCDPSYLPDKTLDLSVDLSAASAAPEE